MRLHFVLISALKDFKRRATDPLAFLVWLGIPTLIGGLMGLVMGGADGPTPRAKLLFVDQDDSLVTNLIVGVADGGGEDSMIELIPVDLDEGRRRIDAGEASALLVIPKGFGAALLEETPVELRLVTNPAQRILPGILEEGLEMLVEAAFYLQRVFGAELAALSSGPEEGSSPFTSAVIAAQAMSISERLGGLEGWLFPPLIELEVEVIEDEQQSSGGIGLLLFPGILFLAMLFIAQDLSGDLWQERDSGTLQRAISTPAGLGVFLLGKLLAGGLIIGAVTCFGLLLGALALDFPLAGLLPALLWGVFSGVVLLSLFMWVQVLGSSKQSGNVLSTVILFPLMMLGGSLFPFEAMPGWMATVGRWTPNGLGNARFKELLTGGAQLESLLVSIALMLLLGLVGFYLTASRVSGRFLHGK